MPDQTPEPEAESVEYYDPAEEMEFAPYDPAEVTPPPAGTPQGAGADTVPETGGFDPRYRDDFEGLTFLGALEARFSLLGHRFVLRTLTTHELLAVGRVLKGYDETIGGTRAYATAMVAMSTVSVDGVPMPVPIAETGGDLAWAQQRFDYVAARWYPFVIDAVYERYLILEGRVQKVLTEMMEQAKKAGSRAE